MLPEKGNENQILELSFNSLTNNLFDLTNFKAELLSFKRSYPHLFNRLLTHRSELSDKQTLLHIANEIGNIDVLHILLPHYNEAKIDCLSLQNGRGETLSSVINPDFRKLLSPQARKDAAGEASAVGSGKASASASISLTPGQISELQQTLKLGNLYDYINQNNINRHSDTVKIEFKGTIIDINLSKETILITTPGNNVPILIPFDDVKKDNAQDRFVVGMRLAIAKANSNIVDQGLYHLVIDTDKLCDAINRIDPSYKTSASSSSEAVASASSSHKAAGADGHPTSTLSSVRNIKLRTSTSNGKIVYPININWDMALGSRELYKNLIAAMAEEAKTRPEINPKNLTYLIYDNKLINPENCKEALEKLFEESTKKEGAASIVIGKSIEPGKETLHDIAHTLSTNSSADNTAESQQIEKLKGLYQLISEVGGSINVIFGPVLIRINLSEGKISINQTAYPDSAIVEDFNTASTDPQTEFALTMLTAINSTNADLAEINGGFLDLDVLCDTGRAQLPSILSGSAAVTNSTVPTPAATSDVGTLDKGEERLILKLANLYPLISKAGGSFNIKFEDADININLLKEEIYIKTGLQEMVEKFEEAKTSPLGERRDLEFAILMMKMINRTNCNQSNTFIDIEQFCDAAINQLNDPSYKTSASSSSEAAASASSSHKATGAGGHPTSAPTRSSATLASEKSRDDKLGIIFDLTASRDITEVAFPNYSITLTRGLNIGPDSENKNPGALHIVCKYFGPKPSGTNNFGKNNDFISVCKSKEDFVEEMKAIATQLNDHTYSMLDNFCNKNIHEPNQTNYNRK